MKPPPGRLRLALLALVLLGADPATAQAPPEPDDYRLDHYQAPTPATLQGVAALTTSEAKALWETKNAAFIDVLPHAPKPEGLPAGTIWNEKPHQSIPGAAWLPEVGRGALATETEDYFKRGLAAITENDRHHLIVIFCKRHCWMSWNAARRAKSYGYDRVSWYSDGIEGWMEAGLPLAVTAPRP